jgi:hypothetical protein
MSDILFTGKCKNGPYAGQVWQYFEKTFPVMMREGLYIYEGNYEYVEGVWFYRGRKFNKNDR